MSEYSAPTTGPVTLRLNKDRYLTLTAPMGWKTQEEHARGLGVSQAMVSQVLSNDRRPSPAFIAALLRAFPAVAQDFTSVFDVVADLAPLRKSA